MVSQDIGQEHLDIFETLDMAEQGERRLKAYTMVDYYCRVISEVSTEYLGLKGDMRTDSLKEQWEQCRTRLQALDDFSVPDDYSKAIYRLHSIRNDVAHDYQKNPSKSQLEHVRDVAADWRSWLIKQAEKYDEVKGELDARKTMIRIAQRSLDEIENVDIPHHEPFASDVRGAKDRAKELSDKLTDLKSGDEISTELVYALLDSKELTQQVSETRESDAHVDWALGEIAEPEVSPEEVGFE